MKWQELAATSHYQTAVKVQQNLLQGNTEEAIVGIEELVEALSRADRRALRSQLLRLMTHIIKRETQPTQRSRSWAATIENARIEIESLLEDEPDLRPIVPTWLKELFEKARRMAEKEMGQTTAIAALTWQQVFEDEYDL
jgi:hypothetical protein